ncbi:MAG TPA: formate/nitrite transporter family protein [Bradyrhizobium sp.]|uniref:formate/nitrite transporter family protein n=1 Tax=Bradyrhizobium sp. TaxID=376 RepID=UPI002D14F124|nr:formate/nitrite transporter family protein [Bradyrhizobium sp.]HLZ01379.1 formate/nitrite transporter family protein [Bradyrhizobium sp.]
MDYAKPADVVAAMIDASVKKLALAPRDILIRGALSGALLGAATTLALTAVVTTGQPIVGALIFPVSLVMIVLLNLELVTGSFAVVPLARLEGKASWGAVISNWSWVFVANLIGSVVFGVLIAISLTNMGRAEIAGVAARIVAVAEAKTIANAALGTAGMVSVFVKAILCNWLVCLGVVMGMTSTSTVGKIAAVWLPIFLFFALGFEHAVVNMFVIPTGMLLGAKVSLSDWWLWNQIPVTLGNIVGGFLFTGLALYVTYKPARESSEADAVVIQAAAE